MVKVPAVEFARGQLSDLVSAPPYLHGRAASAKPRCREDRRIITVTVHRLPIKDAIGLVG
jgi:hypothetical protein